MSIFSLKRALNNPAPQEKSSSRYASFDYTSSEAKRLLGYLVQDNSQAIKNEPAGTPARHFLSSLGLLDKNEDMGNGNTFDEHGKPVADIATQQPKLPRHGTLMHTFNSAAVDMSHTEPDVKKTMDFLSDLSGHVRKHTRFDSLTGMLNAACPGWEKSVGAQPKLLTTGTDNQALRIK